MAQAQRIESDDADAVSARALLTRIHDRYRQLQALPASEHPSRDRGYASPQEKFSE
jgi:hypothetical protein